MRITRTYASLEKLEVSLTGACIASLLMRTASIPEGLSLVEMEANEEGTSVTLHFRKETTQPSGAEKS